MRRWRLLLIAGIATWASIGPALAQDTAKPRYGTWGFDLTAMDRSVRPGDSFDSYASGAWNARTPIPPDQSAVSLRLAMSDITEAHLHALMEAAATSAEPQPASLVGKMGAFYAAFMNEAATSALGAKPIAPELDAIRAARSRTDLAALMGHDNDDFYGSLFAFGSDVDLKAVGRYAVYLSQAGLGLPDRDYYLEPSFAAQKAAYQAYVEKLLGLIGWPNPQANATAVVDFETRIAQVSWTKAQQRDVVATYNPETSDGLRALAPTFEWAPFLSAAGLDQAPRLIVAEKSAFPKIAEVYASTPVDVLKAWQAFTVADNAAFYLSAPLSEARFAFRDKILSGQPEEKPRWKRAIRAVAGGDCIADRVDCFGNVGFGVGQVYTAKYFPPASKAKVEALVADVKAAMRTRLQQLDWMTPATKAEALRKLDTYQIKVGYPDHPRDYSGLVIRSDDLVGDVKRSAAWDWRRYRLRLASPVDRSDWIMTPQTNDAYNGSLRDIVFPAGILQPPLFDPAADPAINYGAIGGIIGHELTHGFDDEGRKLDASGALRDWWTPADASAFEARAKRLGAQYDTYEAVRDLHVNGDLTMGENIADLGGLNVALEAYHRSLGGRPAPVLNGFTGDQRVFLGWAQAFRRKVREADLRKQTVSDPHAPRPFRVIGPTRNIDAWYAAFGAKPGETYYLPPDQRVRIW